MREAPDAGARRVKFAGRSGGGRLARVTRERSGLAHAAGFAGVLFLFCGPLARYAVSHWGLVADAAWWAAFACSLSAPLALGLAFAAGVSLDRSREKAGAMPALFGLVVGLSGTVKLLFALATWLNHLRAL
jgi:hypothetical protein